MLGLDNQIISHPFWLAFEHYMVLFFFWADGVVGCLPGCRIERPGHAVTGAADQGGGWCTGILREERGWPEGKRKGNCDHTYGTIFWLSFSRAHVSTAWHGNT